MEMNSLEFYPPFCLDKILEFFENIPHVFDDNLFIFTEKLCKLYSIRFNSGQLLQIRVILVEKQDRQILKWFTSSEFWFWNLIFYYTIYLMHFSYVFTYHLLLTIKRQQRVEKIERLRIDWSCPYPCQQVQWVIRLVLSAAWVRILRLLCIGPDSRLLRQLQVQTSLYALFYSQLFNLALPRSEGLKPFFSSLSSTG